MNRIHFIYRAKDVCILYSLVYAVEWRSI